ncbi:hypothetical protein [Amycolatopsis orientalis]|uniref:hypothetical protein n=1 Tax=Amycolatopsis orientalis TaxID=31958 RepID=UPI0003A403CC|nr:hypothetical protein [Amycolatopsis orientalis]
MPAEIPTRAVAAAWIALDLSPTEDLPLWAAHWLAQGEDGEHLRHLAGLSRIEPREIHDVAEAALADCHTPIPTAADAAKNALDHLARMLLNGHLTERALLTALHTVIAHTDYADSVFKLPLAQIWLLDEEWDQRWGRPESEIKEAIHAASQRQLAPRTRTTNLTHPAHTNQLDPNAGSRRRLG